MTYDTARDTQFHGLTPTAPHSTWEAEAKAQRERAEAAEAEKERLRNALIAARSDLHEIEAGDLSTFEARDAISVALTDGGRGDA